MKKVVEFQHVTKEYKTGDSVLQAVNDVSFSIDEGEFIVVIGPSGAGKSTILNLLGGMDRVTRGEILVDGKNISSYGDKELTDYRAQNIGFVFQFYNLVPMLNARENIAIVKEICSNSLDPDEILSGVDMEKHARKFPGQLSGGEQQRISIARAIAKNPRILLCDEPTGALDTETGDYVLALVQRMCKQHGMTVIIVTHNELITRLADRVIKVKNGKIDHITENANPVVLAARGDKTC